MAARDKEITGVVLAGGASVRLGRDKAKVRLVDCDLLGHSVMMLSSLLDRVMVVGRDPAPHGLDLPWTLDDSPGHGPAGGIATALRLAGGPCLTVSCDLPFLDLETLTTLLEARKSRPGNAVLTTFLQVETGFIEALVAIYEPEALDRLTAAIDQGCRKLSAIFPPEDRHHIPYQIKASRPFFNVNFPSDLEEMRAALGSPKPEAKSRTENAS